MENIGWLSLLPALVTILIAITTHRVAWALFFGIVAGSFALSGFNIIVFGQKFLHYFILAFADRE